MTQSSLDTSTKPKASSGGSPLDDVTVIEVDSWMAAPSAGAMLADLGADVIKVEPIDGDPMRDLSRPPKVDDPNLREYDFQFDVDNRGKRSIAVALDTQAGIELVHKLLQPAQIFMCNLLLGRQERFRLDPASVFAVKPALVHATLTGYGTEGPEATRPGYDVTAFFGRSGLYDAMREGDEGQVPMARPAQGDHTTGIAFVAAILAALRQLERTGESQAVETSLYETAIWTQATDYAVTTIDRVPVRKRARENMLTPTANRYPCGDGKWIVINMPEASAWDRLAAVLELSHLSEEERFSTPGLRYRNMADLVPQIDATLSKASRDEWGERFDAAGIIWGPVLGLHEVTADPQAQALNLFPEIPHAQLGSYRSVNIPMRFANTHVAPRGPAPVLGEHTQAILTNAGLSEDEIHNLHSQGIIGKNG